MGWSKQVAHCLIKHQLLIAVLGSLFLLSPAHAQDCPNHYSPEKLNEQLDKAEAAFSKLDAVGFTTSMETLGLMTPCLNAAVSPGLSARLHRAEAIRLYTSGDTKRSLSSLLSSRTLQPNYQFPEDLFPTGYALLKEYDRIQPSFLPGSSSPFPKVGGLSFDGTLTRTRPTDRPTLFQHLSDDGSPMQTLYIRPGTPLPDYAIHPKLRNRLLTGTLSSALFSGVSFAYGWINHTRFKKEDLNINLSDLNRLKRNTNMGFGLSAGFSALTTGGAIAVLWVGER
jgi:hypothetical protein